MAEYNYRGTGVAELDPLTPVKTTEDGTILDDALRQIKAYLSDSTNGPDAIATKLLADLNAVSIVPSAVPPGLIIPAMVSSLQGFLLCDGTIYPNASYPALAAAIGSTYGGVPGTSFAVPDCRGRACAGHGGGDARFDTVGEVSGSYTHQLTIAEMPSHTHNIKDAATSALVYDGSSNFSQHQAYYGSRTQVGAGLTYGALTAGQDKPHDNVQLVLAVNKFIKT